MMKTRTKDACTEKQFFEAVGRVIVGFQDLEGEMSSLFVALMAARNDIGARAAFYHLQNNATRIQLMDIAARWLELVDRRGRLRKRWEGVRDRLREASDLRNRVAHSNYYDFGPKRALTKPLMDLSRLEPGKLISHSSKALERQVTYSILRDAIKVWGRLGADVVKLTDDVQALYKRRGHDRLIFRRMGKVLVGPS
jgi:hypothetical protein